MEGMVGMLVLLGLAVLLVPVLLVVALVSISGLKQRVAALEQALAQLRMDALMQASQPVRRGGEAAPAAPFVMRCEAHPSMPAGATAVSARGYPALRRWRSARRTGWAGLLSSRPHRPSAGWWRHGSDTACR